MTTEFDAWYDRLVEVLNQAPRDVRYMCTTLDLDEAGDGEMTVSCRTCCTGHAREMLNELTDRVVDELRRSDRATLQ